MAKRIGTARRKIRHLMSKSQREKGKLPLRKFFQQFENGEKVYLAAEPSYPKGMYFRRFHNKVGIVLSKRGECYELGIKDGNKDKKLIVHPVHLNKLNKA